jgi:hypothetical protein
MQTNYENLKYVADQNGVNRSISVEIGGVLWSVPLDPANTDYINIMALVQEGKLTIAPAS